jgi:hypothetical protein
MFIVLRYVGIIGIYSSDISKIFIKRLIECISLYTTCSYILEQMGQVG